MARTSHIRIDLGSAWALGLLLLSACSSFEFKPRQEIPGMQQLAETRAAYPSRTLLLTGAEVDGEPVRVAMEEIRGSASRGPTLVFLHGVLSNRQTWDYVAGHLAQYRDLLLVDLPGCGDSDKPDPGDLGPDAYNPDWIAGTLMTALGEYLATREDGVRLALVGHSLGATLALRMLAEPALREEHRAVLDRIDAAVLLAPVDVSGVGKLDPTFQTIATLSDFETFLGRTSGVLSRETSRSAYYGTTDPETLPREDWERLYEIISSAETRTPSQWMLRNTVRWDDDLHPIWEENEVHERHYAGIDVPCLLLWGKRDETVEAYTGYKLQSLIPGSQLVLLPRSKHSLPSERPVVVAEQILRFLDLLERRSELEGDAVNGSTGSPIELPPQPISEVPMAQIEASDRFKRDGIRLEEER